LDAMGALAEELRQPAQLWIVLHTRAARALLGGRFDDAEELIREALGFGQRAQRWDAVLTHDLQMLTLRRAQGRLEEMEVIIERSAEVYGARPLVRCALASLYSQLGREAQARSTFELLASNDFGDLPLDNDWCLEMTFLAEVCASLGDARRAKTLYRSLLPHAARIATYSIELVTASVAYCLGRLSARMSHWEDAARQFAFGLATNERIGARPWTAHTLEAHARTLAGRGEPGDSERAAELIRAALDGYRGLGMDT